MQILTPKANCKGFIGNSPARVFYLHASPYDKSPFIVTSFRLILAAAISIILASCYQEAPPPAPLPLVNIRFSTSADTTALKRLMANKDSSSISLQGEQGEQWLQIKSIKQRFWADTMIFHWQSSNALDSVILYAGGQRLGNYLPTQAIPICDSLESLWLRFVFTKQTVCEQPQSTQSHCLLRASQSQASVLTGITGLECRVDSVFATFIPPQKYIEGALLGYRGFRENEREYGLGLHSSGSFSAHAADWAGFGQWSWIDEGKHIALSGYSPFEGHWSDTASIDELKWKWSNGRIPLHLPDSAFVAVRELGDFMFDLRYATENNFMKQAVYPCGDCWLRYEAAMALVEAEMLLEAQNYRLLLFDCYRPLSVQKLMWEIYPNPMYVANPHKGIGSIHNRGGAVDLTVIDSTGTPIDMGTPYDYFGKDAHLDNHNLPQHVLDNRHLLMEAMLSVGFDSIRTEWWHYSYRNKSKFGVADVAIECE